MNEINVIAPYVYRGTWVFDDEERGLRKEALIAGIDMMLDKLSGDYPYGFTLRFSQRPFPTSQYTLVKIVDEERGGTWYRCPEMDNLQGWLCPALLLYFEQAPQEIYVQASEVKADD